VRFTYAAVRRATNKYNLLHDIFVVPSEPLSFFLVNFTSLSANTITILAAAFGLFGSLLFYREQWIAAGLAFAMFFILDCCDGAIARLRDQSSPGGADLDLTGDRLVLVTAVLSRVAFHIGRGERVAAWLCTGYLASHYFTDLQWLMHIRRQAERPRQFTALKEALHVQQASRGADAPARRRSVFQALVGVASRLEMAWRPTPWVCNIAFLAGACFASGALAPIYLGSLLALQWPLLAGAIRRAVKRGV